MNEFEYADRYLVDYKMRGSEIVALHCPFCGGGKHKDKHTFYLNYDRHTYVCHRGSCGVKGTFSQLAKENGERAEYMNHYENSFKPKKTYTKPTMKLSSVSTKAETYITSRGISKSTTDHFGVKSDDNGNIVFPYYNEKGVLELNKIRVPRKHVKSQEKGPKIWQEGGGRPILFGMNLIKDTDTIIITEGEWDCLSVYECGHDNVVSIPFGTENFEWVDECWEWLEKFKNIIIFFDNDDAGEKATKETIRKLGEGKVLVAKCKSANDANELLYTSGKDAVTRVINSAENVPMQHFLKLSDVEDCDRDGELFGLKFVDEKIGGCVYGDLNIWTGKRGGAKSTILSQTAIDCVEQGKRLFWYSGELGNARVRQWVEVQMCAGQMLEEVPNKITGVVEKRVPSGISKVLREWYQDNLFIFGDQGGHNEDDLLKVMEYAYRRYDVRRFILDNLKTVRYSGKGMDKYNQQAEFIARCKDFCNKYKVHIDLVVHPRKSNADKMTDEDVGGSSDIIDLADNVIECGRVAYNDIDEGIAVSLDVDRNIKNQYVNYISILKNREYGNTGYKTYYRFNVDARRIYRPLDKELQYGYIDMIKNVNSGMQQTFDVVELPF